MILLFTKAATPLFVLVFGMTMAFVHDNRVLTTVGFGIVKRRMWRRALLAFLSFEFLVIVVESVDQKSLSAIIDRMLYRSPGNWIEVLNFYIVVLLAGPWLLRWWRKATLGVRLVMLPLLFGLGDVLSHVPVPSYLFVLKNILTGYPPANTHVALDSFPVLQLSSFFLVGLSLGEHLYQQQKANQWKAIFKFMGLLILAGLLVSYVVSGDTMRIYLKNMALDRYRFPPRIPYVLFALSLALGVVLVCLWLVQMKNSRWSFLRLFELLGRHSLFTFNLQYVLLFTGYGLILDLMHKQSLLSSILNTCAIIGACIGSVWLLERMKPGKVSSTRPTIP
jgi:hypothetical protein